jgi:chromosomal replication initiator protein
MIITSEQLRQVNTIQTIVSRVTGIKMLDICQNSRKAEIVQARHLSMYFCRFYTRITTKEIAKAHGKDNHATVLHACKMIENDIHRNRKLQEIIQKIKSELGV